MSLQWPNAGTNSVETYIISGIPFVINGTTAATATRIAFPCVTNFISVKNTASGGTTVLLVAFTENGINDNPSGINRRFSLAEGAERNLVLRVKELWVSASSGAPTYDVVAGMTHVLPNQFPTITGTLDVSGTAPHMYRGVG